MTHIIQIAAEAAPCRSKESSRSSPAPTGGSARRLRAHPDDVEVDVRGGRRKVQARQATPEESAELWPRLAENYPPFKTYMTGTHREFPVMILETPLSGMLTFLSAPDRTAASVTRDAV